MDQPTSAGDEQSPAPTEARRWRIPWLEISAGVVYTAALLAYTARYGAPLKTGKIFVAIMLGLLVPTLRRPRLWLRGLIRDWIPLLVILLSYDLLRGRADDLGLAVHVQPQLWLDEVLTGGETFSRVLQQGLWAGQPRWYDHIVSTVYLSHFVVTLVTLAVLWLTNQTTFRRYRALVLVMILAAFTTYFAYPAAPPWCTAERGLSAPVDRTVFATLGVDTLGNCEPGSGSTLANPVAALPSLHAALPLVLALFFWSRVGAALRGLLATYVVAMAFVLMYGGEHFLFDELLGYAYAGAAFLLLRRRWRAQDASVAKAPGPRAARAAGAPTAPSSTAR